MSTARPPNPSGQTRHEAVVEGQLRRARQRIRLLDITSATLGLAVAALAYGLVLSILDSWLLLPGWCRQTAFAGFGLLVLAYLGGAVIPPLFRRVNPYYAAQQVERTIPEAKNSVVNWLDLRAQPLPPAIRVAVSQKAARDISQADIEHAISARRASWLGGIATGLAIAIAILFFIAGPQQFLSLMGHAFLPFSAQGALSTRTTLELIQPEGGNITVAPYHAVNFQVEVKGKMPATDGPDAIRLLYRYDLNGRYEEMAFSPGDSSREWVAMIAGSDLHNGFWYKVKGGDYESPEYQVRVRSVPLVSQFRIHYHFPAYLRMPDVDDANPNLSGMRGSDVTIVARTNCVVRSGWMEVLGQKTPLDGEPAEANRALSFKLRLEKDCRYRIHFTSADGDNNPEARPYTISVHQDLPPLVQLTSPEKTEVHLPVNGVLQVAGYADDDFGLTGMRLWLKVNGEEARTIPYRSGKSWKLKDGSYSRHLDYADLVDLGKLRLKDGSPLQKGMVLDYCLEATDNCAYPPPGPNVGRSQPVHHVVLDDPQSPQAAQQQKTQAQQETQKKQEAQDKQTAKQGDPGQSSSKPEDQGQSSEKNASDKPEKNGAGTDKHDADHQPSSSDQPSGKGDKGGSTDKNGANSSGTGQGSQAQNESNSQSASGGSDTNGKNDLQDKLKKAQDWLKEHQKQANKPDKRSPQDKGSSAKEQTGNSSSGSKQSPASKTNSKQDKTQSAGDGSQSSGQTQPSKADQQSSQNSGENHSGSDTPKSGSQEPGKGADKTPGTNDKGHSDKGNSNSATASHQPGDKSDAGSNPKQGTESHNPAGDSGNSNPMPGGSGADKQGKGNSGTGSKTDAGAKQDKSEASAGSDKHPKSDGSSTKPDGSGSGTQPKGKGQDTPSTNPEKGPSGSQPKEGGDPSAGGQASPDKKSGHASTPMGGQNTTPTPSDNGNRAGQPMPGTSQAEDKGGEKTDHGAPEKGPTANAADHGNGPDGKHTPAAGPRNQGHPDEFGTHSSQEKAAEQQKLEKDLSDTLKGLQGQSDQELRDLMKKLQSQDPGTRKSAGQKLQDEIRQASRNPDIRKRSEDLLKRLQRLNQENPPPSTGTANANGTEGTRGPTGHEGSRNQAGNSGNKMGPDSPSTPGGHAKGDASASAKNGGKGKSPSSEGSPGASTNSGQGNGGKPTVSGKGPASGKNSKIAQKPGDSNGPGPGDGSRANGLHGTDENGFQPGRSDAANKDFQKKAGVLQLQEFPRNPPQALLRDLHLSEKEWDALRKAQARLIKERQQQASHDTLPPAGSGGHGLQDLKAHQVKSGKDEKDLGFSGPIHPPPGFGDTYREFTQKGSKTSEGK